MTWLKLSDDWSTRPDILALSDGAHRLHVAGMGHCMRHGTDRLIARHVAPMLTPTFQARLVTELVRTRLWVARRDGWYIADPVMDEQPSSAEVRAAREAESARVALFRARRSGDQEAIAEAAARAEQTRDAVRRARAERTGQVGTENVTPGVTPDVTHDVTQDVHPDVRMSRPDPTRPGEPTALSGSVGDTGETIAAGPPRSLAELGVPPPPGRPPVRRHRSGLTVVRLDS